MRKAIRKITWMGTSTDSSHCWRKSWDERVTVFSNFDLRTEVRVELSWIIDAPFGVAIAPATFLKYESLFENMSELICEFCDLLWGCISFSNTIPYQWLSTPFNLSRVAGLPSVDPVSTYVKAEASAPHDHDIIQPKPRPSRWCSHISMRSAYIWVTVNTIEHRSERMTIHDPRPTTFNVNGDKSPSSIAYVSIL